MVNPLLGWLIPAQNAPFVSRPLLGIPCREHVQRALVGAGVPITHEEAALSKPFEIVVFVREDAPCLSEKDLSGLIDAAKAEGAAAITEHATTRPLAIALTHETWESLCGLKTPASLISTLFGANGLPSFMKVYVPEQSDGCLAVQDTHTYAAAFGVLRKRIAQKHLENGVILLDPEGTVIEAEVVIGAGTVISAGNTLQGKTVIGANCTLYPNNRMQNAVIGEETTSENSVLLDCTVGNHTTVGPFAYLRPDSKIGDHCRIGDFVEIKNSSIGDETKISHLTYVGDSDLGKDINLGCGVVFVNYDGKTKSRSRVDDHAFIGCNCNLIAPVHIGENAYLAAGSTVIEDVPSDALYIARSRGTTKEGWVTRRKEQGKL